MYIRRKVYSAIEDENGEIRYFSTNEIVNEEDYLEMLYSEDYLDDEDIERMFSDKKDGMSTGAKVALGAAGTAVAAPLALVAASKGKKALTYKQAVKKARMTEADIANAVKNLKGSEKTKMRNKLRKEADNAREAIANGFEGEGIGFVEKTLAKGKAKINEGREAARKAVVEYRKEHPTSGDIKARRQAAADINAQNNQGGKYARK